MELELSVYVCTTRSVNIQQNWRVLFLTAMCVVLTGITPGRCNSHHCHCCSRSIS